MATVTLISDEEASTEVLAVFDDIRATRGTDFINNFWRALAVDPPYRGFAARGDELPHGRPSLRRAA